MGKKGGGLYENWLKSFTINVMTQSFHAFFLMFVMKMLSEINIVQMSTATKLDADDGILAIMSIVGMMAIIKFEKLFKKLFGLEDAISGDLKGAGAKMFLGLQAANSLQREIREPFKTSSESKRRMNALGKEAGLTKTGKQSDGVTNSRGVLGKYIRSGAGASGGTVSNSERAPLSDKTQELYEKMKDAKKNGNMDAYRDYREHAATQMKFEKASAAATAARSAGTSSGNAPKTQAQKDDEYNEAVLKHRQDKRKQWVKTAGTLASLSMGFGATDETSEALNVANIINDPINRGTSKYIDSGENKTAGRSTGDSKYMERTLSHAIKEGFQDATRNMRNDNGKINPGKMTIEIAKSYVTTPVNTVRNAARPSKVDNVDNI